MLQAWRVLRQHRRWRALPAASWWRGPLFVFKSLRVGDRAGIIANPLDETIYRIQIGRPVFIERFAVASARHQKKLLNRTPRCVQHASGERRRHTPICPAGTEQNRSTDGVNRG